MLSVALRHACGNATDAAMLRAEQHRAAYIVSLYGALMETSVTDTEWVSVCIVLRVWFLFAVHHSCFIIISTFARRR